jgi:hypothetical protein
MECPLFITNTPGFAQCKDDGENGKFSVVPDSISKEKRSPGSEAGTSVFRVTPLD